MRISNSGFWRKTLKVMEVYFNASGWACNRAWQSLAKSRGVVMSGRWPAPGGRPWGDWNCVTGDSPNSRALSFIMRTKPSRVPATCRANAIAASFADWIIRA